MGRSISQTEDCQLARATTGTATKVPSAFRSMKKALVNRVRCTFNDCDACVLVCYVRKTVSFQQVTKYANVGRDRSFK